MRIAFVTLSLALGTVHGFCPLSRSTSHCRSTAALHVATTSPHDDSSFLLDEFKTATGEIVDPYRVLKVSRTAERKEIREAYRNLSRRYHPDGARHRDILPGSCNNHDDIRDEWERVKLSYEILSDKRTRKRYDRHIVLADPGAAMRRAAFDAVGWGLKGVGNGLFQVGAGAVKAMMSDTDETSQH